MGNSPQWSLDEDGLHVTVIFPTDPPVGFKMTANAVDSFLKRLGDYRMQMEPTVAQALEPGSPAIAINDPIWMTELDLLRGQSLVNIRDPRFGWLHFLVPPDEAESLGNLLLRQVEVARAQGAKAMKAH